MQAAAARDLYLRNRLAIFRFLRNATGSREVAEDLTQEVFVRALRGLDRYEEREREAAWLFRIGRRLLLDHRRTERRRPTLVVGETIPAPVVPAESEQSLVLSQALAALAEHEREAFLLRELGGLGYEEIASIVGASADAVRNRICRARRALRDALLPRKECLP